MNSLVAYLTENCCGQGGAGRVCDPAVGTATIAYKPTAPDGEHAMHCPPHRNPYSARNGALRQRCWERGHIGRLEFSTMVLKA